MKLPEWKEHALKVLDELPLSVKLTPEEIRADLLAAGCEPPVHSAWWGSLIMAAIQAEKLLRSGDYAKVTNAKAKSNGRMQRVYARPAYHE